MISPSSVENKRTVQDVIDEKTGIIDYCIKNNDLRGYFCGLYRHVTLAVQKGIRKR